MNPFWVLGVRHVSDIAATLELDGTHRKAATSSSRSGEPWFWQRARTIISEEGLVALWSGVRASMAGCFEGALQITLYGALKRQLHLDDQVLALFGTVLHSVHRLKPASTECQLTMIGALGPSSDWLLDQGSSCDCHIPIPGRAITHYCRTAVSQGQHNGAQSDLSTCHHCSCTCTAWSSWHVCRPHCQPTATNASCRRVLGRQRARAACDGVKV